MRYVDKQALLKHVFGRWTVISFSHVDTKNSYWLCRCSCGNKKIVIRCSLIQGTSKSCGCLSIETTRRHGMYKSPEYKSWSSMIQRCTNVKHRSYKNYGGRGIKVCRRWHKFENFLADIGRRPSPRHSLERKKNHLGYFPSNCTWATKDIQSRNKRTNAMITAFGKTQCRKDWARELGISAPCIRHRMLKLGMSAEQALTSAYLPTAINKRGRAT